MTDSMWILLGVLLFIFLIYKHSKNSKIKAISKQYSDLLNKHDKTLQKCKVYESDIATKEKQLIRKERELQLVTKEKERELQLAIKEKDREYAKLINETKQQFKDTLDTKDREYAKLVNENNNYKNLLEDKHPLGKIASLYSDFKTLNYEDASHYLYNKQRPAYKEAMRIDDLKKETREYILKYKLMQYKYDFLLTTFPELESYIDNWEDLKSLSEYASMDSFNDNYDRVRNYIPKERYETMGINERNQLALDRYINSKNKTYWQVGRDYEMFCAHRYREMGYEVQEFGISKKLEDMGRDLILKKQNGKTYIHCVVQCKRWAKGKIIHEKHLAQLYGTAVMYAIENNIPKSNMFAVFVSNIDLSDTAKRFADFLGIGVECWEYHDDFPRIKCNISSSGEKIYHLPFDQQYDKTIIEPWKGELYAFTVEQAVKLGFRRAFKYKGGHA